jgi:porin
MIANGRRRPTLWMELFLLGLGVGVGPALAESENRNAGKGLPEVTVATEIWPELADPGGFRAWLGKRGVVFWMSYTGEEIGIVSGGKRKGADYEGRLDLFLDVDLEKLAGWKGFSFHGLVYQIHGAGLSRDDVDNPFVVSNIEALATTRLFDLWLEKSMLDGKFSVRAGQLAADCDFMISSTAAMFVNGTFGWPGVSAVNLPAGGPAYPFAAPGVRVKGEPLPNLTLLAAIFDGDPAGPTTGDQDPQSINKDGLKFRLKDPPLLIGEAQVKHHQDKSEGLAGTIKVGAWRHFGDFDDNLANAALKTGVPPATSREAGDWCIYGIVDQQLGRPPGGEPDKGVLGFVRVITCPEDRNLVDLHWEVGFNLAGMLSQRPDDVFGMAFAQGRFSNPAQGVEIGEMEYPRDFGAVLEVSYRWQIMKGWTVQPDLQYIWHPSTDALIPEGQPPGAAVVVGLRTALLW